MWPILRLSSEWALPTYLVIVSLTYCLCIYLAYRRAIAFDRSVALALDICLAIMLGGFLGARLLHVVYEEPLYYWSNPIEIFKVWKGGFVYFGGLFGALLASWLLIRSRDQAFGRWADFFTPLLSLGYAIGRIACFFNGCCYGKFCAEPWAIDFHNTGLPLGPRHPTQLYASIYEFFVFALLIFLEPRYQRLNQQGSKWAKPLNFFTLWLALHSLGRIIMEHFRDDDRGPLLGGLSLATCISIGILFFASMRVYQIKKEI